MSHFFINILIFSFSSTLPILHYYYYSGRKGIYYSSTIRYRFLQKDEQYVVDTFSIIDNKKDLKNTNKCVNKVAG